MSLLHEFFGGFVGLAHLVAFAFSGRGPRRLLQELLDQGGQLVALAPDELLGGDLEIADESTGDRLLLGHLAADGRRLGALQPAKLGPVGDLVQDGAMQEHVQIEAGDIVTCEKTIRS